MTSFFKIELVLAVFLMGVLSGCVERPKPLYYYGNYSESYYASKKYPSEESSINLQHAIEETIKNVQESESGRVPPGMYANLGYLYLKNAQSDRAIDFFIKEKTLYPEAAHFMDRMIKKVELIEGSNNE